MVEAFLGCRLRWAECSALVCADLMIVRERESAEVVRRGKRSKQRVRLLSDQC